MVSTKVGGIPEILPDDMIEFARADEDGESSSLSLFLLLEGVMLTVDIIRALSRAIETIKSGQHDPVKAHERVKGMYAWSDVAERTELVYHNAMNAPRKDIYERLTRYVIRKTALRSMERGQLTVDSLRSDRYSVQYCVSSWLCSTTSFGSWNGMIQKTVLIWSKITGQRSDLST